MAVINGVKRAEAIHRHAKILSKKYYFLVKSILAH
jgi:hypothetical protein